MDEVHDEMTNQIPEPKREELIFISEKPRADEEIGNENEDDDFSVARSNRRTSSKRGSSSRRNSNKPKLKRKKISKKRTRKKKHKEVEDQFNINREKKEDEDEDEDDGKSEGVVGNSEVSRKGRKSRKLS